MGTWVKPTRKDLVDAFRDHGVRFVEHPKVSPGRSAWVHGLRSATVHHTAATNSADYLAKNWSLPGANCVINNGRYNGPDVDGRAVILSWGDCWHSGAGGPWHGVAGEDALHYVSWGIEQESLGTKRDITDPMLENTGRMLAALVALGMPRDNIHRHEDWTDATGPVTGPLRVRPDTGRTTDGRKIDTADDLGYTTALWVKLAAQHALTPWWDGIEPDYDNILAAQNDPTLRNKAAWRVASRLADLDHSQPPQPLYIQGYPWRAVRNYQHAKGYRVPDPGAYGPKLHRQLFGP